MLEKLAKLVDEEKEGCMNYRKLAEDHPQFAQEFNEMANEEHRHYKKLLQLMRNYIDEEMR